MKQQETNHCIYHYWLITGLFLMIATLVSCTVSQSGVQDNESMVGNTSLTSTAAAIAMSQLATPTPLLVPIQTKTATTTPSITSSLTATITFSFSATPTAIVLLPTLTPLPTIPPQQHGQTYADLMSHNSGCALSCWWGIELGITPIEYVAQLYTSLGPFISIRNFENGRSRLTALFIDPEIEDGTQVRHLFRIQDGIVVEVEAQVRRQPNYQIEPLLQQLGQPSEIWMWTIPESYEGVLPASFRLYYPEKGVLIAYAVGGTRVDDAVQICFDGLGSVILGLWEPSIWDPDQTKGFVERANETSELGLDRDFFPIEQVSNWDVDQFYTILADPSHSECLETPSNLWRSPG